jgi:NADH-quinone oxidoreductase subunit K
MVAFYSFTDIGIIIAFLGACGILVNKRNILISVISIELMFYGLNFYLIAVSVYLDDILGEIFSLFILTLAAAESALALALITAYFRVYDNILIREN